MVPQSIIAPPHDPMNEMYEFFAFGEALDNGLSVDVLINEQTEQGRARLENRVNDLILQLNEMINATERERAQLVEEARGLQPQAAQVYCEQLNQRTEEMKHTVQIQELQFSKATQEINDQKQQNAMLVASIIYLKSSIQRNKNNQSLLQGKLYQMGNSLCENIANPNQGNQHNGSQFTRSSSSTGSNRF